MGWVLGVGSSTNWVKTRSCQLRVRSCFVFVAQIRFRTFIILPVSARKTKHAAKLAAKNFGQKAVAERRAPCLPPKRRLCPHGGGNNSVHLPLSRAAYQNKADRHDSSCCSTRNLSHCLDAAEGTLDRHPSHNAHV